jgi:HEPN domain-containing protein
MPDPEDVRLIAERWLAKAVADLQAARLMLEAGDRIEPWIAVFHAQQGAEKAMKAMLVVEQIPFPKSHDLERIRGLLPSMSGLPPATEMAVLSQVALVSRYPDIGLGAEPDREDAVSAVDLAGRVVDAIRAAMSAR